jgi:hypothetical protein
MVRFESCSSICKICFHVNFLNLTLLLSIYCFLFFEWIFLYFIYVYFCCFKSYDFQIRVWEGTARESSTRPLPGCGCGDGWEFEMLTSKVGGPVPSASAAVKTMFFLQQATKLANSMRNKSYSWGVFGWRMKLDGTCLLGGCLVGWMWWVIFLSGWMNENGWDESGWLIISII